MKKTYRSTGILVILVALVASYAYFFEYRGKIEKEAQELEAKKIIPFSLENISEFTIKTANAESTFKKVTEGSVTKWFMEKPHKDVANYAAVQGFLSQFGAETYEDVAAEGPNVDYSIYGLSEKTNSITFVKSDGSESLTVEVGTATALGGKKYLRINQQPKVLMAAYFWESQFQKGVTELREKNLVPSDLEFTHIDIKKLDARGVDHLKFEKINDKWTIKDLTTNDPDQKIVDDLYYQLKNIRASQILKDNKDPADLKNYGLDEPDVKILVSGSDKKKDLEILFSRNITGQIYAATSDRNVIFSLNPPSIVPFKRTHDDYRDKKKPLSFNLAEVEQIDFRSDLSSFKLKKEDNAWKSVEKIEGKEVDNSKVVDILSKLSAMKVKKYFDQEVQYQQSGMIELKLKTSKGDQVLDLKWSPKPMDDVFVAKSNLSEKTFGLSMQDVGSLPFQAVVVDPPKAEAKIDADGMHVPALNDEEKKKK